MNSFISLYRILKPLVTTIITCYFFMMACGCDKTEEVKNEAPTCSITSPVNGDELVKGEIKTISVEAADEDGIVNEVIFKIDNSVVSTTHSIPYQYKWNTSDATAGSHTINVTAKDNLNNTTSHEIVILVIEESSVQLETGTVEDYDGNTYKTVKIGTQWWMAENLKTTHFSNGTEITLIENNASWDNLTLSDKGYCYYNDSIAQAATYGALYNWAGAMNGTQSSESIPSHIRGICPAGWHLPSDCEWIVLEIQLGMSYNEAWLVGWRGTNEGSKMKTKSGWFNNGNGTNSSGFSALPAGFRSSNGLFSDRGKVTHFWSSTEYANITSYAFNRELGYNQSEVGWFRASHYYGYPKDFGFSVRCVKD
jgi:uncharacterized protein (TIGR02145 family)